MSLTKIFLFCIGAIFLVLSIAIAQEFITAASYTPVYKDTYETVTIYEKVIVPFIHDCEKDGKKNQTCDTIEKDTVRYEQVKTGEKLSYLTDGKEKLEYVIEDKKQQKIAIFKYPIGQRDTVNYPLCREYEKEKGVCVEI